MSDRSLRTLADFDALRFDERGMVPVVAQDVVTGKVLMVAWANEEALSASLASGELHFWSRSRQLLWRKGETSGNVMHLRTLHADCDGDTVLALVEPAGPACHTGDQTCFGDGAAPDPVGRATVASTVLDRLWAVIDDRAHTRPEGSYTTRLLGDENLRLKKLGEETAELVAALARGDQERVPEEAADLLYHLLVALRGAGVDLEAALGALKARRR